MAQLFAFVDRNDSNAVLGSNARFDGPVRKITKGTTPPRHALWSFIPAEGPWGILVNHAHAKALICANGGVSLGLFESRGARDAWWKYENRDGGTIALVPYNDQSRALTAGAVNEAATLGATTAGDASRPKQEWKIENVAAATSTPSPLDDAAIDGNFFNFEVVVPDQQQRLYLHVENEYAVQSPVKLGKDPKSPNAQFQLVPIQNGRILSDGKPLIVIWDASEVERIYAHDDDWHYTREVEMVNLNGSRGFVSGDRVALRTITMLYAGIKSNSNELWVRKDSYIARENETFIIKKLANKQVIAGEIKPGDSFALEAANGKHLSDSRGGDRVISAGTPHIDAWETFVLGAPKERLYRIYGKTTGHAVSLIPGSESGDKVGPLVHHYMDRPPSMFAMIDRGDGMVTLRQMNYDDKEEIAPANEAGVGEGQPVGIRFRSAAPGILFRVVQAPASKWPDTPDITMDKYADPAENYARTIAGGLVMIAGHFSGIPGGVAIFSQAFNRLVPEKKTSIHNVLKQFREDIRQDVENMIAKHSALQAKGALELAHEKYLIQYLNSRRANMSGGAPLEQTKTYAINSADAFSLALAFLALDKDGAKIKDTEANVAIVREGLPVYALAAAEYINALQEIAILHAYQPSLVMPEVWLKTRGKYVTASASDGVRYGDTTSPLTYALRVLNKNGEKKLKHGDKVILRSPSSMNVTAANGGGGVLDAKTPTSQIGANEVFTIERISTPPSTVGQEINTGDSIALRAANGTSFVSAPDNGGPLTATAPHVQSWETFTIEYAPPSLRVPSPEPPPAEELPEIAPPAAPMLGDANDARPYAAHIANLATYAKKRYEEVRDMFTFLINDRVAGKHIYPDQKHWDISYSRAGQKMYEDRYSLSFRDNIYQTEYDRVAPDSQQKPPGWDNFNAHAPLQRAMDQYRDHLRRTYYGYKYRYFDAVRPLLTIATETQKICDQMWSDPLMATEFSYVARTTPVYEA